LRMADNLKDNVEDERDLYIKQKKSKSALQC
jgi:hypothetical protein